VADPFNIFMMEFSSEEKLQIAKLYSKHTLTKTLQTLKALG